MVEPVSRSMVISAPPDVIFAILADPRRHVLIDGSGTVKRMVAAPERLALGSRFRMKMRLGAPYHITNTVVEFEEGRRIAWRHFVRHVWRYELEPVEGAAEPGSESAEGPASVPADGRFSATRVTETFDPRTAIAPWALALTRFPQRNAAAIEQTLERLKQVAEADSL